MNRQIRIYVQGTFQFAITASAEETYPDISRRAIEAMKLEGFTAQTRPGIINLVPA